MTEQLFVKVNLHEGRYNYEPATQDQIDNILCARIAELEAQLATWVRLGRRMSAVIAEPENVQLWPLTRLWKDIDDTIVASEKEVKG